MMQLNDVGMNAAQPICERLKRESTERTARSDETLAQNTSRLKALIRFVRARAPRRN